MKHYCVDCMNFLTLTVYKGKIPRAFDTKKIRNAVEKRGRAVIFYCRLTGAYYLNTHRVYEIEACKDRFDDASAPSSEMKISIKFNKGKA